MVFIFHQHRLTITSNLKVMTHALLKLAERCVESREEILSMPGYIHVAVIRHPISRLYAVWSMFRDRSFWSRKDSALESVKKLNTFHDFCVWVLKHNNLDPHLAPQHHEFIESKDYHEFVRMECASKHLRKYYFDLEIENKENANLSAGYDPFVAGLTFPEGLKRKMQEIYKDDFQLWENANVCC